MVDSYSKWVMTPMFVNNVQAALNSGKQIEWVSVKTSDDVHNISDLVSFNDTTLATANIKQETGISMVSVNGNTVTITGILTNINNKADYYIRTLFLVGRYNGTEFLAATTVANSSISAFRMPASSTTEITEFTTRPQISVTNTETISTTVNPVAAATNESLDQLKDTLLKNIDNINQDKKSLWNKLLEYVNKASTETIDGIKTFSETIVGSITGNSGTTTKLKTSRKIGGIAFDGSQNIDLPGVNVSGNQDTSGTSSAAKKLAIERKISLTSGASGSAKFDGSSDLVIEVTALDSTLQKAKQVVDNTDLDNLLSSGMYVTAGKQISNTPIAGTSYATIIVIENQTNSKNNSMIYQDTNTNRIWIRQRKSATWQPWYELFKQGDRFQGDLFVAAPDGKTARIALVDDNNTGNTGLIRYSGLDVTGNPYQGITLLSDNGNLVLGGGEGAVELARALSTGNGLGTLGTYGVNANGERTMVGGDGGVIIIPNLSAFQTGVSGTPEDAIFWDFKPNGTVRTPSGNLLQEVDNSTTRSYGLGQLFDPATYLTFVRSGKVVSVYGNLKTSRDITDLKSYQNENLIPVGYRPFAEFKSTISHNASDGSKKVRGDVAYNGAGNISIDDITIGGNADMNGVVPAGTILTFTATWVMA